MTQRVKSLGEGKETFHCHHARTGLRSRRIVGLGLRGRRHRSLVVANRSQVKELQIGINGHVSPLSQGGKPQYISNKKVCESNKANSQAQINGFYLYHIELKIPYLKCIEHKASPLLWTNDASAFTFGQQRWEEYDIIEPMFDAEMLRCAQHDNAQLFGMTMLYCLERETYGPGT